MKHFTFDLETLGSNSRSPIVQLACVEFDENGAALDAFDRRINQDGTMGFFKPDLSTIEWWLKQSDDARSIVFNPANRVSILVALSDFSVWINQKGGSKSFWSHATFDPPVLMNSYQEMGMKAPISYRDFMDIRTLRLLSGDVEVPPRETHGAHHDALSDCKYQASYIAAMLKKVGVKND